MTTESHARILVVEDNAELLAVLQELLRRAGYEVIPARHGVEALVQLTAPAAAMPSLIILDVNMPLEGGLGVLDFLRRTLHSSIPVIVLTASASLDQEKERHALGISAYLRKPTSSGVLLSEISKALAS